jgi:hypothetical protein
MKFYHENMMENESWQVIEAGWHKILFTSLRPMYVASDVAVQEYEEIQPLSPIALALHSNSYKSCPIRRDDLRGIRACYGLSLFSHVLFGPGSSLDFTLMALRN